MITILIESQRKTLMESLATIDFTYNDVDLDPVIARASERWELTHSAIIVDFATQSREGDVFLGAAMYEYPADDWRKPYTFYGSTEIEDITIKILAKHDATNGFHGAAISEFLQQMVQHHVLVKWKRLIRGWSGSLITEGGAPAKNITDLLQNENEYGYLMTLEAKTAVTWSNIPDSEDDSDTPLTELAEIRESGVDGV